MWHEVIASIEGVVDAKLSDAIRQVAIARGVTLNDRFTRYRWRVPDLLVAQFPALVIRPEGRARVTRQHTDLLREGFVPVRFGYGYRAQDFEEVALHLENIPEALTMLCEEMDQLTNGVLGIAGNEIATIWDGQIYRTAEPNPFEGWLVVEAQFEIYTGAIKLTM